MAVRASMESLIDLLRELTATTEAQFSDQKLQDILDRNKAEQREIYLTPTRTSVVGGTIYKIYDLPESAGEFFEAPVDDVLNDYFYLTDSTYTPFTFGDGDNQAVFDSNLRRITFNTDTGGDAYYLTALSYDVYGAAAELWNIICSQSSDLVDIKTDNHTVALSQARDFICEERISYFTNKSLKYADTRLKRVDQALNFRKYPIIRGFAPIDELY